jgi:hypothetical protein
MATIRPNSDVTTAGWAVTGTAAFYDALDELSPLDTDYITSPALGSGSSSVIMGLNGSLNIGTHYISIRARVTNSTTGYIRAQLLNSSNVIVGVSSWQILNTVQTSYTIPINISGTATKECIIRI